MHAHHSANLSQWRHDHAFGLDQRQSAETRTKIVVAITFLTMFAEIAAGLAFGSMALLADGLHMGSHAIALGVSALAYVWMRRHAGDPRYAYGTGKISALGGFTGAILLLIPVSLMVWESGTKLVAPVAIDYEPAIMVAVIGLAVNAGCAWILIRDGHGHGHDHGHSHDHGHAHAKSHHHVHDGDSDFNLRSSILHVTADALTSLLAIGALLGARAFGWVWLDPLMGLIGAGVIVVWAVGLLRGSSHVLLDRAAPADIQEDVRRAIESDADNRLVDLHVWSIGPGIYAAGIALVTHEPRSPEHYKALLPRRLNICHAMVEVHLCPDAERS